jgi:gluconokinase
MQVPLVVVMGVSGSGKTTVAEPLAARLGVDLGEADDFHPASNVDKMAAGHALDDADRAPWLRAIARWLADHRDEGAVVTCSALKRGYRDLLREGAAGVVFLHLHGTRELLEQRMQGRAGHFMPASLLDSQLETLEGLERDEAGVVLDISLPVDAIVDRFLAWWEARAASRLPTGLD